MKDDEIMRLEDDLARLKKEKAKKDKITQLKQEIRQLKHPTITRIIKNVRNNVSQAVTDEKNKRKDNKTWTQAVEEAFGEPAPRQDMKRIKEAWK